MRWRRRTLSTVARLQLHAGGGIEVERVGFGVEEPFARGVEFLEDILDEAELAMRPRGAVVLPAAVVRQVALGVLAGDQVVHSRPRAMGAWHG